MELKDCIEGEVYLVKFYFNSKRITFRPCIIMDKTPVKNGNGFECFVCQYPVDRPGKDILVPIKWEARNYTLAWLKKTMKQLDDEVNTLLNERDAFINLRNPKN